MRTFYEFLATAILLLHVLIVLFVVGALPVIWIGCFRKWNFVRNFWFRLAHLALIGFVAAESVLGVICPLTTWESELRIKAGHEPYGANGFIAHWLHRFLFYDWDARAFTAIYVTFFALVLLTLVLVRPRLPKRWTRPPPKNGS